MGLARSFGLQCSESDFTAHRLEIRDSENYQDLLGTFFFFNRPFYRYGGHIELIRFKEYYRMPRGHEHISFVFLSALRNIFS